MGTPEVAVICAGATALALGIAFIFHQRRVLQPPVASHPDLTRALRVTLGPTRRTLLGSVQQLWTSSSPIEDRLAGLEEVLITADVGVKVTSILLEKLLSQRSHLRDVKSVRQALATEIRAMLPQSTSNLEDVHPLVILVVGVNGVGKTTAIGKLAYRYVGQGRKVLLVAADTFRAAAGEQLQLWARRVGVDIIRHPGGTDPSAVAFDGINAAHARGVDVVIIDTAGRLHVKANLIEELKKIVRIIGRRQAGAPHEVLLVLDATTGQNAVNQAKVFQEALLVTGIILTKLDGTAKGGTILAISSSLGIPIRFVSYGESADQFAPFDAEAFIDALLAPADAAAPNLT